ncbi:MAG: flagellar biosynthesis protein FlhF [Gammaproteobacteria bacterium]|nr:flagellar biosynthesis protein FlhF [Gammaproteobacteria bacterium]
MKIKRFFAKDMRQAIRSIRDELGPDAVILSNRKVDGGIEIISAIDYDDSLYSNMAGSNTSSQTSSKKQEEPVAKEAESDAIVSSPNYNDPNSVKAEWMEDPMLTQMRQELKSLRGVLESQLSHLSLSDFQRRDPQKAAIMRRFEQLGIDADLSQQFASVIDSESNLEDGWRHALALLAHQIQVSDDDILSKGGVVALVGPTGVGKTTSIAKLAARFSLRHGNRSVALISTDNYRIGAQEQLLNFGRILDVPTYTVNNTDELSERLNDLREKRLVLIDTAGMSQRDIKLSQQLQTLEDSSDEIQTYLVMAANTQTSTLQDIMLSFSKSNLKGCLLTKLDETTSLGGVISTVIRNQIPITYVSDGQLVPEDLHLARAHSMVSRAVTLMQQHELVMKNNQLNMNIIGNMANAHG